MHLQSSFPQVWNKT